ncbi:protein MODIFIER OF SNC1 1-like isoform X2 [Macadamia integrifolia]|uniref:protein MODIFIER OF SNC1 1-like isoform X2 n=1 Tax=Macadamia integrifolia TaxID=60698 RepID=UPI001C4FA468|nr:protein MODIFIER OF SNC1 1-like isoform X2 [Macadamia integrifolia]
MASSMLTGDRRWGSARRGGMTVLGKVTVPKPVNLPSQRLENHGLDPNVEIVPKGTLSWGNCSSSSAPNTLGSLALSPRSSDGVAGSPSWFNGRPSSGGNSTRPSTAGSDRSHEPAPNAWGPNSRPSSSSGALASNQTSMATTRPRSAETRPGSGQLSRFAEPSSENSVAWGAMGTAEKLGAASSKVNRFTLSSGDFPTLGSEKNSECPGQKGHGSQGRPVSPGSGRVSTLKESSETSADHEPVDVNAEGETANTWTGDKSLFVGDGAPPSIEKWQREPQSFPNTTMPHQHLDPWHGTPVRHSSEGVWYRGPPGGPPYGTPGPPGSYPLEPFNYYHPQVAPRHLANSQPVPRPGAGPSNYHAKNGDSYRPQIPESYMRPMMPMRPGVYPGTVPYEGYYGPPLMAMCNPSDRDAPVLGMAAGPCVYNRFPNQNLHQDSGNFHARPGGYGSAHNAMMNEQVERSHSHGTQRGPYKVLLKQQGGWEEKDGEEKRGHAIPTNAPLGGGQQPRASVENDWVTDYRKDEALDLLKTVSGEEASSRPRDKEEVSSVPVGMNVPGIMSNTKAVNDSLVKKEESAPISRGPQQFPATKINPSLIDKIEGLNTKARISEGRYDGGSISSRDEKMKRSRVVSGNDDHSINGAVSGSASAEKPCTGKPISSSQECGTFMRDRTLEQKTSSSTAVAFVVGESQVSAGNVLNAPEVGEKNHGQIHRRVHVVESRLDNQVLGAHQEAPEKSDSNIRGRTGGEYETSSFDPNNYNEQRAKMKEIATQRVKQLQKEEEEEEQTREQKAKALAKLEELNTGGEYETSSFDPDNYNEQRAKMKEIATQRVKQLQKEEEERTREQKAKALAKLEELNRRTQAESSTQKLDYSVPLSCSTQHKLEGSLSHVDTSSSREAPGSSLGGNSNAVSQDSDRLIRESSNFSKNVPLEVSECAPQSSIELQNLSVPLQQDVNGLDAVNPKPVLPSQVQENISSRQKQMDHGKKLNIPSDKNLNERPTPTGSTGASRSTFNVVPDVSASNDDSGTPNDSTVDDPLPSRKRKTNRNGKSKRKLEESLPGALPLSMPTEKNPVKVHVDTAKAKASEAVLEVSSVHVMTSRESAEVQDSQCVPYADQGWSLSAEEAHGRANNQWRPQSRRMPRSQQAPKSADKFHGGEAVVWAPVRSQNKNEASEAASHSRTSEANGSFTKTGQGMQSNIIKGKRAEMERYVPKPAAKEMLQQCSTERALSPIINQSVPDEAPQRVEPGSQSTGGGCPDGLATGKSGTVIEHKNGGSKHNKHGKAHGSWRQCGFTEPPPLQGLQEGSSLSSGTGKNAYKPIEKHQPQESEASSPKGPGKYSDNWTSNNSVSTDPASTDVKDHSVMGRGKRHPLKGQKGAGHNRNVVDHKDLHGGGTDKIDTQTSSLEASQPEGRVVLRESLAGEHSMSQWQPKSQPHFVHNRQGNRGNGSQKVAVHVSRTSGKECTQHADGCASQNDKDHGAFPDEPQPYQLESSKTVCERSTIRSREAKKERKGVVSFKQCGPNQDPVNQREVSPANVDTQNDQQFSSGSHRHGNHNGRFSRAQESPPAPRNPSGQDSSKPHRVTKNGDRRHNLHYEYQPVGSHNYKQDDLSGRAADGSRVMGSRYRERGQNHSRHGANFSAQSSGSVRVAAGYGNGE